MKRRPLNHASVIQTQIDASQPRKSIDPLSIIAPTFEDHKAAQILQAKYIVANQRIRAWNKIVRAGAGVAGFDPVQPWVIDELAWELVVETQGRKRVESRRRLRRTGRLSDYPGGCGSRGSE